jgi:prenyltransferase beta subunit
VSWQLASFAILALALAGGFAWYERSRPPARVLALVAALAALAVVGRLAFAAFPNVKPTTDVVLLAGFALGPAPGFAVGAVTALASNVFLTQGPWTAWQMAAWGGVGAAGGLLARALRGRVPGRLALAAACGLAGLAFGAVMDVYQWTFAAERSLDAYVAVSATSLPYNLAHAIGNVAFALAFGPAFLRVVARYRRRFEVRWLASPAASAPLAGIALAVALAASLAVAPPAGAATSASRGVAYLERAQNRDGGFGGAPGQGSSQLHTGWASLGLAAAGRNPRDVRRGGRSAIDYMRARAGELNDPGELERTILALRAAGLSPRRFAGRDLVAQLLERRREDGSIAGQVNWTAFGILALRAAGERAGSPRVRAAARWLEAAQADDGGFGFAPRSASDVDDTGAVLQALAAAGRGGSPAARRAVAYLRRQQNPDGGFGQAAGRQSNAQSTAWAIQGLVALGRDPARMRRGSRDPIAFLRSLQARNGSFRYSRTSAQTPVWVTAQALAAIARKAFPLRPAPLRRTASASGAAAGGGAPAGSKPSARVRAKRGGRARRGARAGQRSARSAQRSDPVAGPVAPEASPRRLGAEPVSADGGDEGGAGAIGVGALAAGAALALGWRWRRRRA